MTCRDICICQKALKPIGSGIYSIVQKRCQICEIFLKWDGLWCPCCRYRLRTKSSNLKYNAKLRARKNTQPELIKSAISRLPKECVIVKSQYSKFDTYFLHSETNDHNW
jgi:hypothetical protein